MKVLVVDDALNLVNRRDFLPDEFRDVPDHLAVPMSNGQTVPNRAITRMMIGLLDLTPESRVLEVGFGSGYQAAVLSHLCAEVHSVELRPVPVGAMARMPKNVHVYPGNDAARFVPALWYDAILVTAWVPGIPRLWRQHLVDGGRIVAPVGDRIGQAVRKYKVVDGNLQDFGDFAYAQFVPLVWNGELELWKRSRVRNVPQD